jgi:hypothetical protein
MTNEELEDLTIEIAREYDNLNRKIERLRDVLKRIENDMCYKPVHFDWPAWAQRWLTDIRETLADTQATK